MSGTSLDGIDVAIVEIRGRRIETIGFRTTRYTEQVRAAILEVAGGGSGSGPGNTGALSALNFRLGRLYAQAVQRAVKRFGPVELIGCHGQTVYHEGGKHTLQIGEPAVLAERTGVPVVSNFRSRDIAAGGQGAPLVPYVDYLLFRHRKRTRIALNIGGIANVTIIPAGAGPERVIAFDTGPGNMVIDALAVEYSKGELRYDRGGKIARSGNADRHVISELLLDSYYQRRPPKSAGREQYGTEFVARLKESGLPLKDLIATATAHTARTIAYGIHALCLPPPVDVIVSGGGIHNRQMMAELARELPQATLSTSTSHGINADAKEAIAFAVLAYQTWQRHPSNLKSATGAQHSVILGSITP